MRLEKKTRIILIIVIIAALVFVIAMAIWHFLQGRNPYKDTFYPGTTLNGIDISGMTPEEVQSQLEAMAEGYELAIVFKTETVNLTADDIELRYNVAADLQGLKDEQNETAYEEASGEALIMTVDSLFSYNEDNIETALGTCESMNTENMTAPEDAMLVYDESTGSFFLSDGDAGSMLSMETVLAAVEQAIEAMETELDVEASGLYLVATLRSDSDNAQEILDEANSYLSVSITYIFNNGKEEIIDSSVTAPWIYLDENLEIQIDNDLVQELVNTYADNYSSSRISTDFTTTGGSVISINVPVSGETIDTNALFEDIITCLEEKISGEREVPYSESAVSATNNFGGNYVEVDLTNQKLYLYKNGELIMSSNIVSGSVVNNNATPTGVYQVYSMAMNVTLKGTDYATPVSYWMPFNGGIGFHDATWRSSFGGTIYQYSGSHGCINMPYEKAKILYNNISVGYYVVVYGGVTYVSGQSSGSSSSSSSTTEESTTESTTKSPTESATMATESTKQTEATTEAATESTTEATTEAATEASTEAATEASTEAATEASTNSNDGGSSDEDSD